MALAHQAVDGRSLIMVNMYSRPPTDAKAARWGQSPLQEIAFDAAHMLINVTLPALSVARPDGYIPLFVEQATEVAGQCAGRPDRKVCRSVGSLTAAPITSTWPGR